MAKNDKNLDQVEPTADIRKAANMIAQMYVSLVDEGFSPIQAMYLVGQSMRGPSVEGPPDNS